MIFSNSFRKWLIGFLLWTYVGDGPEIPESDEIYGGDSRTRCIFGSHGLADGPATRPVATSRLGNVCRFSVADVGRLDWVDTWTHPDSSLASTTAKNFYGTKFRRWTTHIESFLFDAFAYSSEAGAITVSSCRMILEPRTYSSVWCADSPITCLVVCIATDSNITAMNRN
jgi:hypothetical protein